MQGNIAYFGYLKELLQILLHNGQEGKTAAQMMGEQGEIMMLPNPAISHGFKSSTVALKRS